MPINREASSPVNLERGVFGFFALLLLWQAYSFFFRAPLPPAIGDPSVEDAVSLPQIIPVSAPRPWTEAEEGRDPFVPKGLTLSVKRVFKKPPPDAQVKPPPKSEPKGDGPAPVLPPKPAIAKKPESKVVEAGAPPEEEYVLPLEVKGIVAPEGGGPLKVLVVRRGTADYMTLSQGDEFAGVFVRKLTPESVTLENELGDRFRVEVDPLRREEGDDGDDGGNEPPRRNAPPIPPPADAQSPEAGKRGKDSHRPEVDPARLHALIEKVKKGEVTPERIEELMKIYRDSPQVKKLFEKYMKKAGGR